MSNLLVAQAERLEAAFWEALTQAAWVQARQIAALPNAPAHWMQLLDQVEVAADAGRRRQVSVGAQFDAAVPAVPTPVLRWLMDHVPGQDVRKELLSVLAGLPDEGRINRQRRAHVAALLQRALNIHLELLRSTTALRAISTAHPEDTVPSADVVQQAVDAAYVQLTTDAPQQVVVERLTQVERCTGVIRGAELAQLKALMYDVARALMRVQLEWCNFRAYLVRRRIDPAPWVVVAPIPPGVDGTRPLAGRA